MKSDKVLCLQHGYHVWEHFRTMKVPRAFHGSLMFQNLLKSKRKEVGEDLGETFKDFELFLTPFFHPIKT